MIENEIYCYINDFLKWNISKNTSYMVGNRNFSGKTCIPNLKTKEKVSLQEYSLGTKDERRL